MLLALFSATYVPSKWLDSLGTFGSYISAFNIPPGSLGFLAVGPLLAAGAFHLIAVRAFINRTHEVDSAGRPGEGS
jgi:hypothetical protein